MNTLIFVNKTIGSSENLFLVYSVVVIILDEQIFLTYVLAVSQEGSKSKEQVSRPKVCIVENWKQFPVLTLNLCRTSQYRTRLILYNPADTQMGTRTDT